MEESSHSIPTESVIEVFKESYNSSHSSSSSSSTRERQRPLEDSAPFFLRYYSGSSGRFGHEFIEYEIRSDGRLRYANGSHYKREAMIRKEMRVSSLVISELKSMILSSGILEYVNRGIKSM